MKKVSALVFAAALAAASAAQAAADTAVEAPIRAMLAAFNRGDVAAAKATHIAAPMILDEPTAPFTWSGPTAFDDWVAALGRSEAAAGKTGGTVALGAVTRESVEGDRAYVVLPSTYSFQQRGHAMRETGTMTFALVRQPAGWKIAAWAWTSPVAVPVR